MMRLHNLSNSSSSRKSPKRVGRGPGSGRGKTCGVGHKGQGSRAGGGRRIGFESGHVPFYRRLPKRGFNNARFAKVVVPVNVGDLDRVEGEVVNKATLVAAGLLRARCLYFKILAKGDLSKALKITASACSRAALLKIEAVGGTFTQLESTLSKP